MGILPGSNHIECFIVFWFFCFFQLVIYSIARFHCLFHVRVVVVDDRRGAPLAVVIRLSREAVLLSFLPKLVFHHFESMQDFHNLYVRKRVL